MVKLQAASDVELGARCMRVPLAHESGHDLADLGGMSIRKRQPADAARQS